MLVDAVVDTDQPRLQVGENRWMIGRYCSATSGSPHSATAKCWRLPRPASAQSSVTISDPGATVLSTNPQSDGATRSTNASDSVRLSGCRAWCPRYDWNRGATPSPRGPPTQVSFMVLGLSTDPVLVGPHHGAERGRLSAKDQVAAETARRTCRGLTGDQISGPEPDVQRSVGSITVPTVSPVFWRHLRQRRTPGRFSKWNGSPAVPQCGQAKPSPQRAFSR